MCENLWSCFKNPISIFVMKFINPFGLKFSFFFFKKPAFKNVRTRKPNRTTFITKMNYQMNLGTKSLTPAQLL